MAIDYATDIGQVRVLIADVDEDNLLLTDEQIRAYLKIARGRIKRAAAQALDAIATSEVLISKKIRTQDLQTDGPAVAAELRAQAKALREQADEEDEDWGMEIVYFDPNAEIGRAARRERGDTRERTRRKGSLLGRPGETQHEHGK